LAKSTTRYVRGIFRKLPPLPQISPPLSIPTALDLLKVNLKGSLKVKGKLKLKGKQKVKVKIKRNENEKKNPILSAALLSAALLLFSAVVFFLILPRLSPAPATLPATTKATGEFEKRRDFP
jgi:uncharacterized membrane protein YbhN (UPF0104 family)